MSVSVDRIAFTQIHCQPSIFVCVCGCQFRSTSPLFLAFPLPAVDAAPEKIHRMCASSDIKLLQAWVCLVLVLIAFRNIIWSMWMQTYEYAACIHVSLSLAPSAQYAWVTIHDDYMMHIYTLGLLKRTCMTQLWRKVPQQIPRPLEWSRSTSRFNRPSAGHPWMRIACCCHSGQRQGNTNHIQPQPPMAHYGPWPALLIGLLPDLGRATLHTQFTTSKVSWASVHMDHRWIPWASCNPVYTHIHIYHVLHCWTLPLLFGSFLRYRTLYLHTYEYIVFTIMLYTCMLKYSTATVDS